ncbi:uncharacterized protein SAPINGB_P004101 [Magnusiomyces paraingens]|uniref:Prefoldin subunit 4 n=1 Tax=Magnusiomyces paraingens TaxID=2606893 RepID=A0A5E8BUZ2_9ASCO|nr:uncharacterized protein SAPINGB_P004101 [Saprochaete ingens]VVT54489.1 unnamed protein product [Saprochaete ingens]
MLPADHKPNPEIEVLWEDQERINTFSKLNSRIRVLKDRLKTHEQEKEYLSDVEMELELLDEDDQVQYKIGEAFIYLSQEEALERLQRDTENVDKQIQEEEQQIGETAQQMTALKGLLYGKFGNAINLEA